MMCACRFFAVAILAFGQGQIACAQEKVPESPVAKPFVEAADYSAKFGGRAVLVQQGGKIHFERYDNGWSRNLPHPLASGSKSFVGVLAMMAVEDGLLSLEEKAADTLVEWKEDPRKSRITVRQLLNLSSGLSPGTAEFAGGSGTNILGFAAQQRQRRMMSRASRPDNNFVAALELGAVAAPGDRFQYGPSHFYAFGELLQRKLQRSERPEKTTLDYLRTRLIEPLGLSSFRVGRDAAGNPNLPGGVLLTARDWARFGQFVLDSGTVTVPGGRSKSLLHSNLLAQCFVPSAANGSYGLTWWLGRTDSLDRDLSPVNLTGAARRIATAPNVYVAAGLGKQRLYIVPELDLVVVRYAEGVRGASAFSDQRFLRMIVKDLPADAPGQQ